MRIRNVLASLAVLAGILIGTSDILAEASAPDMYIDLDFFLGIRDPIPDTDEVVIVAANVVTGATFTEAEATGSSIPTAPMTFTLHPTPTSTDVRWQDVRTAVPYGTDGHVRVLLGAGHPIPSSLFVPGVPMYLEIVINGDVMDYRISLMIPRRVLLLEAVSGSGETVSAGTSVEERPPVIFAARPAPGGAVTKGRDPRVGRVIVFEDAGTTGTQWMAARQSELTAQLAAQGRIISDLRSQLRKLRPVTSVEETH